MPIQTDEFPSGPRLVAAGSTSPKEEALERALRPKRLADYVGQPKVCE